MDKKDQQRYANLPIPTYEEATSSRPASSQARLGPQEISDDAERQGLLRSHTTSHNNYEPPSVESARPSVDSLNGFEGASDDGLRAEIQQMDIEEPNNDNSSHRSLLTYRFTKRLTNFTNSFSSLNLSSLRRCLPQISFPRINFETIEANRVVIIGRLFGIFLIVSIVYLALVSNLFSFSRNRASMGQIYDPESIRMFIQDHMNDGGKIQEYLRHITQYPHIAGTEGSFVLGEWIAALFKEAELESVNMEAFHVYLNYPQKDGRKVAIVEPEDRQWEAILEEDYEETYVFHGHSKAGNVTGPLIYANYGSPEDFQALKDNDISLDGAVVLVKYYGTQGDRALKVKAAELSGAVGCIIYSDPTEDGMSQGPTYPDGRFMPPDGVQRGTVSLTSYVVGDVLSPGWASTPAEQRRLDTKESPGLVQIPSIPMSWNDAEHLLNALKGHGKRLQGNWQGLPDIEYWTGDHNSPVVSLSNMQYETKSQPIYNVLGRITGWEQPLKRIIVGNHRDAWCVGAADPGSGTAVMLEVIRIFGELRRLGWRPLRTIEFASWDAEEYNLIGSTEHVENRLDELRRDGYAYVNVDVAVSGIDFHAAASPVFEQSLLRVLSRVSDPFSNNTIRNIWDESERKIEGLGAGSDYVAFQHVVGTSSIDMFFKGAKYPYHSCYDNFEWMEKYGDPGFAYHKKMGEIWALLIMELADKPVLPFDMEAYARIISEHVEDLDHYARDKMSVTSSSLNMLPLRTAAETFEHEAKIFHEWDIVWSDRMFGSGGFESNVDGIKRMSHNSRMANFETHLLDLSQGGGLPNRTQYKHVISAPQLWSGYEPAYFPGVRDALDVGDWSAAQKQLEKAAEILGKAARKLNGN